MPDFLGSLRHHCSDFLAVLIRSDLLTGKKRRMYTEILPASLWMPEGISVLLLPHAVSCKTAVRRL